MGATPVVRWGRELYASANTETSSSQVVLVVLNVMHEHVNEHLVEALDLAISLRVVRRRLKVRDANEVSHTLEEQEGELGSFFRQDCVRGPVHGNPISAERRRDVRRSDASQWDGLYNLQEPVNDDQEKNASGRCLCHWSEDVYRHARDGIRHREQLEHLRFGL